MLGSLFFGIGEEIMPYEVNDTAGASMFKQLFHEIVTYYGKEVELDLEINLQTKNGDFLSIDKTRGFVLGEKQPATISLMVYADNSTTKRDLALQFDMNLNMVLNMSMSNLYVYVNIPTFAISNVVVVKDKVGLFARDYNSLLNIIMNQIIDNINVEWTSPWDMRVL